MNRIFKCRRLFGLDVLVGLFCLGAGLNVMRSQTPSSGKPQLDGLRATVAAAKSSPTSLQIQYTLQWRAVNKHWELSSSEPVNVKFWSAKSALLPDIPIVRISLDPAFVQGSAKISKTTFTVTPPPLAKSVSVELGTSGLETARTPVP